jgi:hypothetical protein
MGRSLCYAGGWRRNTLQNKAMRTTNQDDEAAGPADVAAFVKAATKSGFSV